MQLLRINRLNRFLDKLISYKGIDKETLLFKKTYWTFIVLVTLYVAILTFLTFKLEIDILFLYGCLLLGWYIPLIFLFALIKRKLEWMAHISQHLAIFITFFIVIKIGGITNCGGIIIAALSAVVFSIMFYSITWSIWYFTVFVLCTLTAFFIQTTLKIPPGLSPEVNHLFFLINTLGISGLIMAKALIYLNQYTQREKDKTEQLKELDNLKSKFYSNITHEFRTPISVILGATDQIESLKHEGISSFTEKIKRNSNRLLSLINQMLDLSKLEAKAMPLNFVRGDIIQFIRYVAESFELLAENKKLSFSFDCPASSFIMDYDPDKLTQVISNLLINAIKFTPEKGLIKLTVMPDEKNKELHIIILDTGIGMNSDQLNHLFERFYQNDSNEIENVGSGLGLAITKELVHLLKGEVKIESEKGTGTKIKVVLPVTKLAPIESQPEQKWTREFIQEQRGILHPQLNELEKDGISSVLIVEDNPDVSEYICSLLENKYKLTTARNGVAGFAEALKSIPDIIISDIMMPKMDGIELLTQLKRDIRTSHIPVILLTAKADMESKIEGISIGAEAYLTKPFQKEELFARIATLIHLRKELQRKYSAQALSLTDKSTNQSAEDSFMKRIRDFFDTNIDNEEVAVSDICEAMNMSRTQLYRKFGALTNRSVSDYFRSFRLHRARQLLLNSDLNVTQVAFEVGFKNLSHFSKSFASEFGISPSQFKKEES